MGTRSFLVRELLEVVGMPGLDVIKRSVKPGDLQPQPSNSSAAGAASRWPSSRRGGCTVPSSHFEIGADGAPEVLLSPCRRRRIAVKVAGSSPLMVPLAPTTENAEQPVKRGPSVEEVMREPSAAGGAAQRGLRAPRSPSKLGLASFASRNSRSSRRLRHAPVRPRRRRCLGLTIGKPAPQRRMCEGAV